MKDNIKVLHISDTHTYHGLLSIPDDIDMIIFSGDESNPKNPYLNEQEARNFLCWYQSLNIKYKIFIAGNHSTAIEKGLLTKEYIESLGIIYLENSSIEIEGINIYGSPITPTFGEWSYMMKRSKLHDVWSLIPGNTHILVVHGPPKGVLDLSYDMYGKLEFCGCLSLKKRINIIKPILVCFGHIHNNEDIINTGVLIRDNITYSNAAAVKDGKFGRIEHNGNLFNIDLKTKEVTYLKG